MGIAEEIVQKIDNIFHSITLVYVTIIFYILLYVAFRKKMAASKSLQEHKTKQDRGRENKQPSVFEKFKGKENIFYRFKYFRRFYRHERLKH